MIVSYLQGRMGITGECNSIDVLNIKEPQLGILLFEIFHFYGIKMDYFCKVIQVSILNQVQKAEETTFQTNAFNQPFVNLQ